MTDRDDARGRTPRGEYSLRLHRIITVIVGLAALSTDVLSIPGMLARRASDPLLADTVRYTPLVVLPLLAGILAGVAVVIDGGRGRVGTSSPGRDMRTGPLDRGADVLLWVTLVWYLLVLVLVPSGTPGVGHEAPVLAPDQDFLVSFSTPVVAATCLMVGRRARFVLAVVVAALSAQFMGRTGLWTGPVDLQGPVFLLAFNVNFLAAATWVLDQGRRLDISHASRERREAQMRLVGARDLARRRTNDFVHDHVLSALVPAAAGLDEGGRLQTAARLAVRSLEGTATEDMASTAAGLFSTLSRRTHEKYPEVQVRSRVVADHEVPPTVGQALLDATGEALSNSARHARERTTGAGVHRSVLLVSSPSRVLVTIVDDGCGFDGTQVPPGRHGIRYSIVNRVTEVGGRARVDPGPGRGTRVELVWDAPRVPVGDVPGSGGAETDGGPEGGGRDTARTRAGANLSARVAEGRRSTVATGTATATATGTGTGTATATATGTGTGTAARAHTDTVAAAGAAAGAGDGGADGTAGRGAAGVADDVREGPWAETVASSMQTRGARAVGLYAFLAHVYLVATSAGAYTHVLPVVLALLAQFGAGVLLLRTWPEARLPRWVQVTVPLVIGASNLAVLLQIPGSGWPGYAAWSLGSATMLCWGLIMREKRVSAWSGWGMLLVSTSVWVLVTGRPLALAASMTVGHLVTVALWDLVASWSGRAALAIAVDERRQIEMAVEARAQAEVRRLEDEAMASVAQRAVPLLEEVASGAPLSTDLRMRARLLEAELRDEIRAPCFTGTLVVAAARAARSRGVDVVLLDDGPGQPVPTDIAEVMVREVVAALEHVRSGRAVVRRLPAGRSTAATVVAGGTRVTIAQDGVVDRA